MACATNMPVLICKNNHEKPVYFYRDRYEAYCENCRSQYKENCVLGENCLSHREYGEVNKLKEVNK